MRDDDSFLEEIREEITLFTRRISYMSEVQDALVDYKWEILQARERFEERRQKIDRAHGKIADGTTHETTEIRERMLLAETTVDSIIDKIHNKLLFSFDKLLHHNR